MMTTAEIIVEYIYNRTYSGIYIEIQGLLAGNNKHGERLHLQFRTTK